MMKTRRDHRKFHEGPWELESTHKKMVGRGKSVKLWPPTRTASTPTATKPHSNLRQPILVEHGKAHELDAKSFFSTVYGGFFSSGNKFFFFEVGPLGPNTARNVCVDATVRVRDVLPLRSADVETQGKCSVGSEDLVHGCYQGTLSG